MPGHTRLYRRGAMYYHRAAIPEDIKETYPKTEETFSLGTKDYQEALKLVRKAAVEVDQRFEAHRQRLHGEQADDLPDSLIDAIGELYYAEIVAADEEQRLGGLTQDQYDGIDIGIDAVESDVRRDLAMGKISAFALHMLNDLLEEHYPKISINKASDSWLRLTHRVQEAHIKAIDAIKLRQRGRVVKTPARRAKASSSSSTTTPILSEAVQDWIAEKSRTSWNEKTTREHTVWINHFLGMSGDKPLDQYGKSDGRAFKAMLLKLPADWNKKHALKSLDIASAAQKAHELGITPMSDSNLNKLLGFVGSFWRWAERNYDECPANLFGGLHITIKSSPRDERNPFSVDELKVIFNAPIYTGCQSAYHWSKPGSMILRDAGIYWVPLVGLFSGARAGEIIQLYVEDVKEEEGITYLDINKSDEGKKLKTDTSLRKIPVHKQLVELGFLDHVEAKRKLGDQRLFPELQIGADGYYSSPFSKHFRRFLESIDVKHRKNSFHSFRHNFEDACRNSGIAFEVMNALQGHVQQGMAGRYGEGYSVVALSKEMVKLEYVGLDLSFLLAHN